MSLNIKSKDAHRLASELARLTGQSLTEAVTEAIREKLQRVKSREPDPKLMEDMARIAHDIAARMSPEVKALDIDDLLYDENGMPK